jgi:nitrite reductase/ring-hydroxylating ferredoxin subunit/uncharacterized membrane protein
MADQKLTLAEIIENHNALCAAEDLQATIGKAFEAGGGGAQKLKNFLHGTWLGHPLHPALTDVPLGAWTVALILDGIDAARGRDDLAPGADAAVGIGLIGAAGAAATGLADWQGSGQQAPRTGLLHGLLNVGATGLYAASLIARKSGHRKTGLALSLVGYAVVGAAAYLGGELVAGERIGVDHAERESLPGEWTAVLDDSDLPENTPTRVEAGGVGVLLVRQGDEIFALGELCSHLAGPLAEGEIRDCSIVCPWHGSRFDLRDGKVLDGPATFPQPRFQTRVREGQVEVRALPANS